MNTIDFSLSSLQYAYEVPSLSGEIRTCVEDFQVDENLGFEPDGQGEHHFLLIRKVNTNTEWVARQLARFAGVKSIDVSFAGLKDRNAITTQWFSVRVPGLADPDWNEFSSADYQVLEAQRHSRKLRRGSLKGNRFSLRVRNLHGNPAELESRLKQVSQFGVPNYFAEQRFGHHGDNLKQAHAMLVEGKRVNHRHKRSLYLSAARSYLFNQVCSARVKNHHWKTGLNGDAMILSGSHSFFIAETIDPVIKQRLADDDIVVSGPRWGRGELQTQHEARQFETSILNDYQQWCKGLEKAWLKQERRALCVRPVNMSWQLNEQDDDLNVQFSLPAGSYATSVLREIIRYR